MVITVEMTNLEQSPVSDGRDSSHPADVVLGTPSHHSNATGNGYQALEENNEAPMSPIEVLEEVLYNRPSLRLGREVSMRFRAQTSVPSRRRRVYHSLQHRAKRPRTTDTLTSGVCWLVYFVCHGREKKFVIFSKFPSPRVCML